MTLVDQLATAKGEKRLSKAPILRRLMLRSAVFSVFGTLGLTLSLISGLSDLLSVDPYADGRVTTFTRAAFGCLVVTTVAYGWMLVRAFMLSRARAASDLSATQLLLKRLKVALATLLTVQGLSWIMLIALGTSLFDDKFPANETWPWVASMVLIAIWLFECNSAQYEVSSLVQEHLEIEQAESRSAEPAIS